MKERIETALVFLKDNKWFKVGELNLAADKPGLIDVSGWSSFTYFDQLNKTQCFNELEEVKIMFKEMLNVSPELRAFVESRDIQYHLYFDDYGKTSIWLCSEKNGITEWGF